MIPSFRSFINENDVKAFADFKKPTSGDVKAQILVAIELHLHKVIDENFGTCECATVFYQLGTDPTADGKHPFTKSKNILQEVKTFDWDLIEDEAVLCFADHKRQMEIFRIVWIAWNNPEVMMITRAYRIEHNNILITTEYARDFNNICSTYHKMNWSSKRGIILGKDLDLS